MWWFAGGRNCLYKLTLFETFSLFSNLCQSSIHLSLSLCLGKVPEIIPDPSCDPLRRGHPSAAGPGQIEGRRGGRIKSWREVMEVDGGVLAGYVWRSEQEGHWGQQGKGRGVYMLEPGEKWSCRSAGTASPPRSTDQELTGFFFVKKFQKEQQQHAC